MANEIRISETELFTLLSHEDTAEQTLEKYFELDFSDPFKAEYKLKKNIILLNDDGTTKGLGGKIGKFFKKSVMNTANNISRRKRNKKYRKIIQAFPKRIRIVSEGDSWFQHPLPKVKDIIDHLFEHYAIYSLGAGGDELRNMFAKPEYLDAIEQEKPKALLLSAGGNDILGRQFKGFLNEFKKVDAANPGKRPKRFFNQFFFDELDQLEKIYSTICNKLKISHPDLQIFMHGYDYIIPNNPFVKSKKSWTGKYMIKKGIESSTDKKAIIRYMLDRFNAKLKKVAKKFPNVHYIDVRKKVNTDEWYDEIHPNSKGFQNISLEFHHAIDNIL